MYALVFVLLSSVLILQCEAQKKLVGGLFDTKANCEAVCKGFRDAGCTDALADNTVFCRCQPGYFNNNDQCYVECENQQFWSLFTYGRCVEISATASLEAVKGQCNRMCAFRVRVWATVFTIILFFSACTLLVLMLPGFITSCYTCCFLQKQKRRTEEDQAIQAISGGDPHGTVVKSGAHHGYTPQQHMGMQQQQQSGWQYPFYGGWPYYGGSGR